MSHIQTVLGPVAPSVLGRVMIHEHLLSLVPGPWLGGERTSPVDLAVAALAGLRERGYGTIVDLSPYAVVGRDADGANAALLAEISRRSGLHIVAGTALYLESWTPDWAQGASIDEIADRLVRDIEVGIGESGVKAGVLGEQATGLDEMSEHEERALRAAARASRRSGAALMTHTTHGTLALRQLEILLEEEVELGRVVVGHMDTQLDAGLVHEVVAAGACVAVDTIGKQEWDYFLGPPVARPEGPFTKRSFRRADEGRADLVAGLVEAGHVDRVVLAQDMTGAEIWMNPDTHGVHGYRYLHDVFRPMLLDRGVSEADVDRMLITNPARLLELP